MACVGGFELKLMLVSVLTALGFVCGCASEPQRHTQENAAIQKEAAREMRRICALPPAERDAELERIKKESGMVVQCGKD
jgi:hypothetical protein